MSRMKELYEEYDSRSTAGPDDFIESASNAVLNELRGKLLEKVEMIEARSGEVLKQFESPSELASRHIKLSLTIGYVAALKEVKAMLKESIQYRG